MCSNPKRKAKMRGRKIHGRIFAPFIMHTQEEIEKKVKEAEDYNRTLAKLVRKKRITDYEYSERMRQSVKLKHLKNPATLNANKRIHLVEA